MEWCLLRASTAASVVLLLLLAAIAGMGLLGSVPAVGAGISQLSPPSWSEPPPDGAPKPPPELPPVVQASSDPGRVVGGNYTRTPGEAGSVDPLPIPTYEDIVWDGRVPLGRFAYGR